MDVWIKHCKHWPCQLTTSFRERVPTQQRQSYRWQYSTRYKVMGPIPKTTNLRISLVISARQLKKSKAGRIVRRLFLRFARSKSLDRCNLETTLLSIGSWPELTSIQQRKHALSDLMERSGLKIDESQSACHGRSEFHSNSNINNFPALSLKRRVCLCRRAYWISRELLITRKSSTIRPIMTDEQDLSNTSVAIGQHMFTQYVSHFQNPEFEVAYSRFSRAPTIARELAATFKSELIPAQTFLFRSRSHDDEKLAIRNLEIARDETD